MLDYQEPLLLQWKFLCSRGSIWWSLTISQNSGKFCEKNNLSMEFYLILADLSFRNFLAFALSEPVRLRKADTNDKHCLHETSAYDNDMTTIFCVFFGYYLTQCANSYKFETQMSSHDIPTECFHCFMSLKKRETILLSAKFGCNIFCAN